MRILKEAKYKYLRDKARRNRNYTLIASLPIFIFILFIIYALFFDQEFFFVLGFWWLAVLYILVPSHLLRKYLNYRKGIRGEKDHSGLFKNIWVNALVVFVNPHIELALHKPTLPVLRLFEVSDFIKRAKTDKSLPDKDLGALGEVILKNTKKR